MTFDEFLKKLDKNNPYYEILVSRFQTDIERRECVIERRGPDLLEVVQRLINDRGLYPIVDKKLGAVFGVDVHSVPRYRLFHYHHFAEDPTRDYVSMDEAVDRYISEGHGWFISKMRAQTIVASIAYRPDKFDKDVFAAYRVDHQDLTRDQKLSMIHQSLRRP